MVQDEGVGARGGSPTESQIEEKAKIGDVRGLASDWKKTVQPVVDMQRQFDIMESGLDQARQGDMNAGSSAVIVTFNKILDPTSVVRESEFARTAEGVSIINRLIAKGEKIQAGGAGVRLEDLEEFNRTAKEFLQAGHSYIESEKGKFQRQADYFNIPQDLIFGEFSSQAAPAAPATDYSALSDDEVLRQLQGY